MHQTVVLLTAGVSMGLSGACQPYRAHERDIAVEIHEGTNLSFDLSPDGRWIMLDLVGQLWRLPAGGGEALALTDAVHDTAETHDPKWSPDGTRVLFWRGFEPINTYGVRPLWVLGVDSGVAWALVPDTVRFMDPAWHPSGQSLVVVYSRSRTRPDDHLYRYDLATGALSAIRADSLPPNTGRRLADPTWAPDGRTIAVVAGRAVGPIWEVDVASGTTVRITPDAVRARQPVYSPDGTSIAFVEEDSVGTMRIWVQGRGAGTPGRRTVIAETAHGPPSSVGRVAWTPDGQRLVFVRAGRLWSVAREGGAPTEIPFTATVRITQERPALPSLRFPRPGSEHPARGFTGMALAPGADRVAVIALDSLWIVTLDGGVRSIAHVRRNATGLSWAPDGRRLVWSGGLRGEEDLYATDIATGVTRALTAIPGRESRPAWSPDGRWIAFQHSGHLRVLAADGAPVQRADQATDLGPTPGTSPYTPLDMVPQWSGDGSSLLLAQPGGEVLVVPLQGARRTLRVPPAASAIRCFGQDSVVYLLEDQLHAARLGSDSTAVAGGRLMTKDAALYPAVTHDGTVAYVSGDGLRVRRPDGAILRLGWPIRFRTPTRPDIVIQNVRLVPPKDGGGEPSDIVISNGRIERITRTGGVRVTRPTHAINAEGRFAIPGLIDLHQHPRSEGQLRGMLYFGVTTVRDMGNPIANVAALRDAVTAGAISGPRVVLAGLMFYPGCVPFGGAWCQFTEFEQSPSGDTAAARGLALARAFGIEVVKLYSPGSLPGARRFVQMAHRLGLPVTGHAAHNLPMLASGMFGEEHAGTATGIPAADSGAIAPLAHAAGLVITPTLSLMSSFKAFASDTTIFSNPELAEFTDPADRRWYSGPPFVASRVPEMERAISAGRAYVRRLHEAGVILGAGTDIQAPSWALHTELEELVASGLTPEEALAAATSTAARVLRAEEDIGAIAPGHIADLVILDADPLTDISNTRRIWRVIQGGRVVDRVALLHAGPY